MKIYMLDAYHENSPGLCTTVEAAMALWRKLGNRFDIDGIAELELDGDRFYATGNRWGIDGKPIDPWAASVWTPDGKEIH